MKNIGIFILGAAAGSVITWKLVEKKYKDLADEEIASVVETFKNRKPTDVPKNKKETKKENKKKSVKEEIITNTVKSIDQENIDYTKVVKDYSTDESEIKDEDCVVEVETGEDRRLPRIITPQEFDDQEDYGTKTLTYYADGVLTDEVDDIIPDPDILLGEGALDHFGEYEDDALYIRDDDNEMDYEVLKSDELFGEIYRGQL